MTDHLEGIPGRHTIVLITDGYDENSVSSIESATDLLRKRHVTAYVVAIGGIAGISLKGERLLRQLADATGGKAFFPPREQDLVQVYDALAADAQHRYLVTYTPSDQTADGTWREIVLTTRTPKLTVRTRPGYFAPKPPPIRPSLEFTVTDAASQYVDVTADDLEILEDGVPQKIDTFEEAVTPVSLVLAMDASGSMRRVVPDAIRAAVSFVESLRKEDSLGIVTFADTVALAQDLSLDRQASLDTIADYKASGGTALYDALDESLVRLGRVQGRRVVVVFTDGRDEDNPGTGPGSVRHFDDVVARLRATGATVFAIGLGTKVDRKPLEEIAALSGGEAYFPTDVSALAGQYRRIVENLRRRWVVSYTSTNAKRDGAWRTVKIRARSPSQRVASGGGYYAPEK
jgi:VWFA-related protein